MSLFAAYLKERTDKQVFETRKGFIVYKFLQDAVYIEDIYIVPECRGTRFASKLADLVARKAKNKNLNSLLGSVDLRSKNACTSVEVLIAYGMRPFSAQNDAIWFKKDI